MLPLFTGQELKLITLLCVSDTVHSCVICPLLSEECKEMTKGSSFKGGRDAFLPAQTLNLKRVLLQQWNLIFAIS